MLVRLNCWRGEHNPGDVVDVDDVDAAALIAHGAGFAVDDLDAALDAAEAQAPAGGRIVRGEAALQSASGTDEAP